MAEKIAFQGELGAYSHEACVASRPDPAPAGGLLVQGSVGSSIGAAASGGAVAAGVWRQPRLEL